MADSLYAAAGVGPDDIDAAMIYDAMSPQVFMALERQGFVKPGEAKDFIASGEIRIDGRLPVNTNGGLMGEAYIHGMNLITEAVRQLRGTAVNQIAGRRDRDGLVRDLRSHPAEELTQHRRDARLADRERRGSRSPTRRRRPP